MTNGQGHGGRKPPPTDDRTLLDPLSNDELLALREARARMQQKKGSAVAHQIVIGPDAGEDIGDAPTRAMPALPSFEADVSLDQIGTGAHRPVDPAARAQLGGPQLGGPPSEPMSVLGPTAQVPPPGGARGPAIGPGSMGPGGMGPGGPTAGPTGFGENTLLWMQPPKPVGDAQVVGGGTPSDILPKVTKKEVAVNRMKTFGVVGVLAALIALLLMATLRGGEKGVIELHTNPPKAQVKINGKLFDEQTPVKLTLPEGQHTIELILEGHQPHSFTAQVAGKDVARRDIDLDPVSKPGLLTVAIDVQPVAANITVDGKLHASRRTLKLANLDPKQPHKITVEAGGYVKLEQDIQPNQLKPSYNFVLQLDDTKR